GENLAWSSRANDYSDSQISARHASLWGSDGHQRNMLSSGYREIGVGFTSGNTGSYVTQKFGNRGIVYLTGVVTDDLDEDLFYDVGEGLGEVRITAWNDEDVAATSTWDAGGYSLALEPGTYTVRFEGGDLDGAYETTVTIGSANVKLDVIEARDAVVDPTPDPDPEPVPDPAPAPEPEEPATPGPTPVEPDPSPDLVAEAEGLADTIAERAADHEGTSIDVDSTGEATGSDAGELIRGDGGRNVINGADGTDIVLGGGGRDMIDGGDHADDLSGEGGADDIDGGHGFDNISGGAGADDLSGGRGRDTIQGDSGDDVIAGGGLQDLLVGGSGDDIMKGGAREDVLITDGGSDILWGQRGIDHFVFDEALGAEDATILDFDPTLDMLVIGGAGEGAAALASFLSSAAQSGSDVVYTTEGGATLTIVDTMLSELNASHFATLDDALAML
ncbi:MAG: hypothetical protein AAGA32_13070, partial [Pseudomonadota bacterium]